MITFPNNVAVEENATIRVTETLARCGAGLNPRMLKEGTVTRAYVEDWGGHAHIDHPEEPWCLMRSEYEVVKEADDA